MRPNQFDTMIQALLSLRERGFTASFHFDEEGCEMVESHQRMSPKDMTIVEHHRFEGDSSADDMSVVYAVECQDGAKGTIVDSFGAYADPFLATFLKQLDIHEET